MLYQVFKKKQERKDCLVSQPPGEASFPLLVLHNLLPLLSSPSLLSSSLIFHALIQHPQDLPLDLFSANAF